MVGEEEYDMPVTTENNLFFAQHKYAKANRQGENFVTATFVHLLLYLRDYRRPQFGSLVKKLTKIELAETDIEKVSIVHQKRNNGEQPDFRLSAPTGGAIIEVKLDADPTIEELYYSLKDNEVLVLLTRDRLNLAPKFKPVIQIQWENVAQWLEDAAKPVPDSTSQYFLSQFRDFLIGIGATTPHSNKARKGPYLSTIRPTPGPFMYTLVPLVMKEFSINELIDVWLHGVINFSSGKVRDDLFEDEPWITDRSFIDKGLENLFVTSCGISDAASTHIRSEIIKHLLDRGLDPEGMNGKGSKYELYRDFMFVKYPLNRQIEGLTPGEIRTMDGDVPVRAICRPRWFEKFGAKKHNDLYFGGWPLTQVSFYGENGRGGRFPLRPGTPLPGDLNGTEDPDAPMAPSNEPAAQTDTQRRLAEIMARMKMSARGESG